MSATTVERVAYLAESSAINDKFVVKERTFTQQYAKFYEHRLKSMHKRLTVSVRKHWGSDISIRDVCDVKLGEECVLIGTTFKQMNLQPSILKELSDEINSTPQPARQKFTCDSDELFLEDMVQRIALRGKINPDDLTTGVVLAVKGREMKNEPGHFDVEEICFAELTSPHFPTFEEDKYVLLVSGLELGGKNTNTMGMDMLREYLRGDLMTADCDKSSKICKIIIAGNSISNETYDKMQHFQAKYLTKHKAAGTVDAIRMLTDFLHSLTESIPVDVLPGEFDPTDYFIPQQPIHPCMLQDQSGYLNTCTNPYMSTLDDLLIVGTGGQPVDNIRKFSGIDSSMDVMKKTLQWCHLAPTAPDTLSSYAFVEEDPFILDSLPSIYFTGNQPVLSIDSVQQGESKCLCISLPKFSDTGISVLVNLRTLEAEPLQFAAGL